MESQLITTTIILLFLGSAIVSSIPASQQRINLSQPLTSGNILYVGGGGPGNYTSIQDAINAASDGDTIFCYNRVYHENIIINKSIAILGQNRENTIIDGTDIFSSGLIVLRKENISFSNITVRNAPSLGISIRVNKSTFSKCTIVNNGLYGVIVDSSDNCFMDCLFRDSNFDLIIGTHNSFVSDNIVADCEFSGPSDELNQPLTLHSAQNNIIRDCTIEYGEIVLYDRSHGNRFINCSIRHSHQIGMNIEASTDTTIENCVFDDIDSGWEAIRIYDEGGTNIQILECSITNSGHGIGFWGSANNALISNCVFSNNVGDVIYFFGGVKNTEVSNCSFIDNSNCFEFWTFSFFNHIIQNNFIDNTRIVEVEGWGMCNIFQENYWSDYRGWGPYHVWGFLNWDFHPSQEPYQMK